MGRLLICTSTLPGNRNLVMFRFIQLIGLLQLTMVMAFVAPKPNVFQKLLLKVGRGKKLREEVVSRYFDGVLKKDRDQIYSCFNPEGTKIRDVCGVSNSEKLATPDDLADRCMEFLAAHPDTKVMFHYG